MSLDLAGELVANEVARVRYTEGQFLGASDFRADQAYHRLATRRHHIGNHTWGIVVGFELTETPDAADAQFVDPILTAGFAIDGYGRQIVSFASVLVDPILFDPFTGDAHHEVWIAFTEEQTGELASTLVCDEGEPTRTVESFRIVVDPVVSDATVTIDGVPAAVPPVPAGKVEMPLDRSVPYQEMPGEPPVVPWLVRVGALRWDAAVRRFRPAGSAELVSGRVYAGVVADHALAPAETFRLAPRDPFADVDAADFATVEGRLRVEGRINAEKELWMEGEAIRFTYTGGAEENVPVTLLRQHPPGGVGGHQLRLRLGDDDAATDTSFSIGTQEDAAATTAMEVRADGRVLVPTGVLDFGTTNRQEIDLSGPSMGIGTQPGVLYLRSSSAFAWFRGGTHSDTPFDNPAPGQVQMTLSDAGNLEFGARTRQMIDLWAVPGSHNYGIGVQAWTLYFRTDSDVCWFRGGSHSDTQSSAGSGGVLAMRLDGTSSLEIFGGGSTHADLTVGKGGDAQLITRHVRGKLSGSDGLDNLYLNWNNGADVVVGNPTGTTSDLFVSGSLVVSGPSIDSVCKVRKFDRTVQNNGGSPGNWTVSYPGEFDSVQTVYVVMTGFSITGDSFSSSPGRDASVDVIPQTVWVRVDSFTSSSASGTAFHAQSDPTKDGNNEVSFTLVVIGRKWS
jgi:hypothetical protein